MATMVKRQQSDPPPMALQGVETPIAVLAQRREPEQKVSGAARLSEEQLKVLRRLLGGTFGGVLQAATSHPFDTVKSRVQNGVFPSLSSCVKWTWQKEGLYGFYRGVTPPLFLGGLYNSILFSLNQQMTNLITPAGWDTAKTPLPLWRTALAAELTAPLYVLALTPMEKVKVMLQVQGKGGVETKVTGPVSCIRSILQTEGPRGLLSGYTPTLMSRLVGLPFYFMGYQLTREYVKTKSLFSESRMGRELFAPMLGGVVAGLCFWTSNYPFDFIKTQLQASPTKISIPSVVRSTFERGGIRAFYKGFTACLMRSCPANASVWLGVEVTTRFMMDHGW